MASKALTESWRDAWAGKPSDSRLMGAVCGPREVDPAVHSSKNGALGPEVRTKGAWRAEAVVRATR